MNLREGTISETTEYHTHPATFTAVVVCGNEKFLCSNNTFQAGGWSEIPQCGGKVFVDTESEIDGFFRVFWQHWTDIEEFLS